MEGELKYYQGVVSGFKKVYASIDGSDFVTKKNQKDIKEILRIRLDLDEYKANYDLNPAKVLPHGKENLQFIIALKKKKHYFKTNST